MGSNNSKGFRLEQQGPTQPPADRSVPLLESPKRINLVLLGGAAVGKTHLLANYIEREYTHICTVGVESVSHPVSLPDGRTVRFQIWDTGGQDRWDEIIHGYLKAMRAAAVVYDITCANTFTKAKYWVTELQKNAPNTLVMVLVGNKSDLAEKRQVPTADGQAYAASNAMMFLETSAIASANVTAVFDTIIQQLAGPFTP